MKRTNARTDELSQIPFSKADKKRISDSLRTKTVDEMAQQHVANSENLNKGTGLWIRDDLMFQAWEQEKAPILRVVGKWGVGKTYACSEDD